MQFHAAGPSCRLPSSLLLVILGPGIIGESTRLARFLVMQCNEHGWQDRGNPQSSHELGVKLLITPIVLTPVRTLFHARFSSFEV